MGLALLVYNHPQLCDVLKVGGIGLRTLNPLLSRNFGSFSLGISNTQPALGRSNGFAMLRCLNFLLECRTRWRTLSALLWNFNHALDVTIRTFPWNFEHLATVSQPMCDTDFMSRRPRASPGMRWGCLGTGHRNIFRYR